MQVCVYGQFVCLSACVCLCRCGYLSRHVQVCARCQRTGVLTLRKCAHRHRCPAVTVPLHTRMPVMVPRVGTKQAKAPPGAWGSQKGNGTRTVTTLPTLAGQC